MTKVSIIIPAYNAEKTISETIDSILEQSYQNFEINVINDGSTDGTEFILNNYSKKDKRIKIYTQDNSGVSISRNKGIEKSTGKYISFLDADDLYHSNFLEKMLNQANKNDADVCYCGTDTIPESSKRKIFHGFSDKEILIKYIKGKIPVHTRTWLIKKEYIENKNMKFPVEISWGEDLEFFYEIVSSTNKITYVPEYLTFYRNEHSENQLSNFKIDLIDHDYIFIMRIINNKNINKNSDIEKALLNYRLSALITHKLWTAVQKEYDIELIKKYYRKYYKNIEEYEWSNGLRSLSVNIKKRKLKKLLGEVK